MEGRGSMCLRDIRIIFALFHLDVLVYYCLIIKQCLSIPTMEEGFV